MTVQQQNPHAELDDLDQAGTPQPTQVCKYGIGDLVRFRIQAVTLPLTLRSVRTRQMTVAAVRRGEARRDTLPGRGSRRHRSTDAALEAAMYPVICFFRASGAAIAAGLV